MYIEELIQKPGRKSITMTMSYDEIRDIANGLYHLTADDKKQAKTSNTRYYSDYDEIAAKTHFLFDMIKHGNIQPETTCKLYNLQKQKEEEPFSERE